MASRKKTSGILIYNLLVREVTRINKTQPESKQLSLKERREFITNKIYPTYKGKSKRNIRLGELREFITKKYKRLPRRPKTNILAVDPVNYVNVDYFSIDHVIGALPKGAWVQVLAGEFGETDIFNTNDFDYHKSGTAEITNNINEELPKRKSGEIPIYIGKIRVRPKKKNDGVGDSYYLEMSFDPIETTPLKIPRKKKTKKQKKKDANIRAEVEKQLKAMKPEKSPIKKLRQRLARASSDFKRGLRSGAFDKKTKAAGKLRLFNKWTKIINKNADKEIITARQKRELLKEVKSAFGE